MHTDYADSFFLSSEILADHERKLLEARRRISEAQANSVLPTSDI
jgi:hypothetical protein